MATKSVLKTIYIKKAKPAHALVSALENASGKKAKDVVMSRPCATLGKDEVLKMFGREADQ
jgi:prolyl-tRNA editing enzyme YbaK/EbsC (Cys-tRNA(Pro) deacylase)